MCEQHQKWVLGTTELLQQLRAYERGAPRVEAEAPEIATRNEHASTYAGDRLRAAEVRSPDRLGCERARI